MKTAKEVNSYDVVEAILVAEATKSPGLRAKATRYLNRYVDQRVADGFNPVMVEAGIKARVTRLQRQK